MNILALDLSSKSTGYAVAEDGQYLVSGYITASSTDYVARIYKICNEIGEIIKKYNIEKIYCEEVRPETDEDNKKNKHTQKVLMYLQAQVVFTAHDISKKIECEFLVPSEWRAAVGIRTGRGIKREELKAADIKYVELTYGKKVNDDEADAIGILDSIIKPKASGYVIDTKDKIEIIDGFEFE